MSVEVGRKKNSLVQIICLIRLDNLLIRGNKKEGRSKGDFQISDLEKVLDAGYDKRREAKG